MNQIQTEQKVHKFHKFFDKSTEKELENLLSKESQTDKELHEASGALLLEFIKNRGEGFKDLHPKLLPAAMSGYNGSTRAMSTARVADAMQFTILREMTDDKEKLADYVRAMLPQYIPS